MPRPSHRMFVLAGSVRPCRLTLGAGLDDRRRGGRGYAANPNACYGVVNSRDRAVSRRVRLVEGRSVVSGVFLRLVLRFSLS